MPLFLHLSSGGRRVYVNADQISRFETEHGGSKRTVIYFSFAIHVTEYVIVDETIDEVLKQIPEIS